MSDVPIEVGRPPNGGVLGAGSGTRSGAAPSDEMSSWRALAAKRERLQDAIRAIEQLERDYDLYDAESSQAATIAACWAATLMVADILKIGLSAGDRRAKLLFGVTDRTIERAQKTLQLLGFKPAAKRADVLNSIDPSLHGALDRVSEIRAVRDYLRKASDLLKKRKIPVPDAMKIPKEIDLVLDLSLTMTEDTLLLMQAGLTQQAVRANIEASRALSRHKLQSLKASLRGINARLSGFDGILDRMEMRANIA